MTPKQYVRVLQAITELYPNDAEKVADRFVFVLRRNRNVGLFSKIVRAFSEEEEREIGAETIRLQTARSFSKDILTALEAKIRSVRNDAKVKIVWSENEHLSGGVRVRIGERGYDESIARRFRSLEAHVAGRE